MENSRLKEKIIMLIILGIFFIIYLQAVTLFTAKSYNLNGFYPFYYSIIWAVKAYHADMAVFNNLMKGYAAFLIILFIGLLVIARYRYSAKNKQKLNDSLHGSARWARFDDIKKMGLLSSEGVVVGAFETKKLFGKNKKHYLIHNGAEHILTYAPTRSGKGVGLIVPTLTTWKHSVIATDIKGELWSMTAGYRQKYLDNIVMKFEPASKNSVKWNPFDEIRVDTDDETADAQSLALLIVDPQGKGLEDHWVKSAYSLITGCILYLIERRKKGNGEASLSALDKLISDTSRPLTELWEDMKNSDNVIAKQVGQDMFDKPENEGGSIVSTAKTELSLYRDPVVAENTSFSNFKVKDLMNNDKPVTLYIVVQPKDIQRITPIFRLLINMIIRVNVSDFTFQQSKPKELKAHQKFIRKIQGKPTEEFASISGKGNYKHRLLMMLDEFPSLGKMDVVQTALAYCAGYGIKCYLITQDLAQLQEKYGKNEAITSNCHIQNAYAPNKIETAEYLSKQTGETTVIEEYINESDSGFLGRKSYSKNIQYTKRSLLTPDECLRLKGAEKDGNLIKKAGEMLIFVAGFPAIKGIQPLYFQEPVWQARASILPPEKSDVIYDDEYNITENIEENNELKGIEI